MKLIFNELSISIDKLENKYQSRDKMYDFIKLCRAAILKGSERSLLTALHGIETYEISSDYTIHNWLTDNEVSREQRSYLRSLLTRSFSVNFENETHSRNQLLDYDFKYRNYPAKGLGFAYLLNGLAISLGTSQEWSHEKIHFEKSYLDSESEEILTEYIEVVHSDNAESLQVHDEWYENAKKLSLKSGLDIWLKKEEIFRNLIFCENAKNYLSDITSHTPLLSNIVNKLFDLEKYSSEWDSGNFTPESIRGKVTPDSGATLEQYGEERKFIFPDGRREIFSWHSRVTPAEWRIFFFPDFSSRKIIIGHIGPKLRTVRYN